jgi:hypothetical protein
MLQMALTSLASQCTKFMFMKWDPKTVKEVTSIALGIIGCVLGLLSQSDVLISFIQ